jgi:hypothetical protein
VDEPKPAQRDEYVESERQRRLGNFVILGFFLVIVGIGVWLANAMIDYRKVDDCLAQGRRNCAPIDAPAR